MLLLDEPPQKLSFYLQLIWSQQASQLSLWAPAVLIALLANTLHFASWPSFNRCRCWLGCSTMWLLARVV